jgi:putative transposase
MARLVVPQYPHHVTQRGNRRQKTFFTSADFHAYLQLIAATKSEFGIAVWAYCLMPNHVHFIVVPDHKDSLAMLFREVHRRYTFRINHRNGWRGHLWQDRFHSCVLDERHLLAAARYVELNPVRAGLCADPSEWRWSSVQAHIRGRDDQVVCVDPLLNLVGNWRKYLQTETQNDELITIRQHSRTGRPLGSSGFVEQLEQETGRSLRRRRPGPKGN